MSRRKENVLRRAFFFPMLWVMCFAALICAPVFSQEAKKTDTSEPAQTVCSNCPAFFVEVLQIVARLQPGTTREQIEKDFVHDGGIDNGVERYDFNRCTFVKIDVEFESADPNAINEGRPRVNPKDRVVKISKPYIEAPFMD